ncbi:acyl-CoA thioester hydrolase [Hymenobacter sp. UYAg731]
MLQSEKKLEVRFCEVDSMHIVWHGHYLQYLEEGREDFGRKFGLGYRQLAAAGYGIPIVDLQVSYKQSLRYGDALVVETRYRPTAAPKLCFDYRIRRADSREIVCTGRTTQVFIDAHQQLLLLPPPCFTAWLQQWQLTPEPAL